MKLKTLYESSYADAQTILHVLYEYLSERSDDPNEIPLYPVKPNRLEINQSMVDFGHASLEIMSPQDWVIASLTVHEGSSIVTAYDPTISVEKINLADPDSLDKIRDFCYRSYRKRKVGRMKPHKAGFTRYF